jgi:hypothetical protein
MHKTKNKIVKEKENNKSEKIARTFFLAFTNQKFFAFIYDFKHKKDTFKHKTTRSDKEKNDPFEMRG